MSKVILVAGMSETVPIFKDADYIGIDYGAVRCMKQQIPMVMAVGDFDSTNETELEALQSYTDVRKLPAHKNETDSEEAIACALKLGYDDLILYGSLGGRIDHEMANFHLLIYRDLPITLMDEQNIVKVIKPGTYKVQKLHTYLSFLALEESCITETGVAYPLQECKLSPADIFPISNEITDAQAMVTLHYGRMLMMQSDDRK